MKVVKLYPDSKDTILKLLQDNINDIVEFHVVILTKDDEYDWYTTAGEDKFRTVGALEYLKSKLLGDK